MSSAPAPIKVADVVEKDETIEEDEDVHEL